MKQMRLMFLIFILVLGGYAEQSSSTVIHHDGILNVIQTEISVEQPIDVVWKKLEMMMIDPFFDVKKMDEKKHTIVFKFFSDKPCNFVECGIDEVASKGKNSLIRTCEGSEFKYKVNKPNSKHAIISSDVYTFVDGIATIYLESREEGTSIAIDIQYKFHIVMDRNEELVDKSGKTIEIKDVLIVDECNFSTLEGRKCNKLKEITCFSNGVFEKVFLNSLEK